MRQQSQALWAPQVPPATSLSRGRLAAPLALTVAGVCFVLYPAIRPFTDESSLRGAQAFASPSWLVAHTLAMAGFILVTLGLWGLYEQLRGGRAAGRARAGLLLTAAGAGLTLPYYGAECFGLHAVGQQALKRHDPGLLVSLTHGIRWEEGVWFIIPGLLLIGAGRCPARRRCLEFPGPVPVGRRSPGRPASPCTYRSSPRRSRSASPTGC